MLYIATAETDAVCVEKPKNEFAKSDVEETYERNIYKRLLMDGVRTIQFKIPIAIKFIVAVTGSRIRHCVRRKNVEVTVRIFLRRLSKHF